MPVESQILALQVKAATNVDRLERLTRFSVQKR
jgi:hypothetical protein